MISRYAFLRQTLVAAFILAGNAVSAESFSVSLGERALGMLTYDVQGGVATMISTMDNTPLGVFNGTFQGQSDGRQYRSLSKSSRKTREIATRSDNGRVVDTIVSPQDERTDLSDPAMVPADVIDPVATLGRFIDASGCPDAFRIYDGRRAILVQPVSGAQAGSALVCEMSYRVTHGPGHLSPLYIKSISVTLTYHMAEEQSLQQMEFGAAGFDLRIARVN